MNWIRISIGIGDDPRVHVLADELGVTVPECVGLLVLLLTKLPEHAQSGDLSTVPDSLLERWAWWAGQRGNFAPFFRRTFLSSEGVWTAWDKHNGLALSKAERDRERLRLHREEEATRRATVARQSGDGRQPVAGTDGRTYEVQTTGRSRARTATSNGLQPIRPHLPAVAVAPPWCAGCGDGILTTPDGQKRPVRTHAPTCHAHGTA